MGVIYAARGDENRDRLAVKVVEGLSALEQRFRSECQILQALEHDNIACAAWITSAEASHGRAGCEQARPLRAQRAQTRIATRSFRYGS